MVADISVNLATWINSSEVACYDKKILVSLSFLHVLIFRPRKFCGEDENSTCKTSFQLPATSKKYIKSSMYKPKQRGGLFGIMVPLNKHGKFGMDLSLIDLNADFAFSYQCLGERLSPYKVFFNRRYVFFGVIEQLWGGE